MGGMVWYICQAEQVLRMVAKMVVELRGRYLCMMHSSPCMHGSVAHILIYCSCCSCCDVWGGSRGTQMSENIMRRLGYLTISECSKVDFI